MTQITLLRDALQPHLGWHGARLMFLANFLIALFRVKTVNLMEIATAFVGMAQQESHYKRLQRFFRAFEVDYPTIAKTVVAWMSFDSSWVLTLDGTQWQFGQHTFNDLVLGIAHQGIAFPILWALLDKRGNCNTTERIDIIKQFLDIFPVSYIAYLTADREFLGKHWFGYLLQQRIPVRIRIRASDKLYDGHKALKAQVLFQDLQPNKVLSKQRRLWGRWLYVAALRLEDGSLLVVVTSDSPATALTDYAQRWQIETLFGCFKSRGFCLESTHLSNPERLSKLLALLTLALCWAFRTGEWLHQQKPLKIKKHGRKAKSLLRYGFDHLRTLVFNLELRQAQLCNTLHFLSCT